MTKKLSRRNFLTGGTAAIAFTGIATGANAQNAELQSYIDNSVSIFQEVFRQSGISSNLTNFLEHTLNDRTTPRNDRALASGILRTLQSIEDRSFNRLNQNDQITLMRCALRDTGRTLTYLYSSYKGAQSVNNNQETRNAIRNSRSAHRKIRRADNALDPLFRYVTESCTSIYNRAIGNSPYRPQPSI